MTTAATTSALDSLAGLAEKAPGFATEAYNKAASKFHEWSEDPKSANILKWSLVGLGTLLSFGLFSKGTNAIEKEMDGALGDWKFLAAPFKLLLPLLALGAALTASSFGADQLMGIKSKTTENLFSTDEKPTTTAPAAAPTTQPAAPIDNSAMTPPPAPGLNKGPK